MKVHGKKGKNYLVELTPYEMETIRTALMEWQEVEDTCVKPVRSFSKVFKRVDVAIDNFESLPLIKNLKIG